MEIMTGRDRIRGAIAGCRRFHKPGMILTLVCFPLMPFYALFALPCCVGVCLWAWSIIALSAKLKCPNCGHCLSYLVTDPSYSKVPIVFHYPVDIPADIEECPYCHWEFASELESEPRPPKA